MRESPFNGFAGSKKRLITSMTKSEVVKKIEKKDDKIA